MPHYAVAERIENGNVRVVIFEPDVENIPGSNFPLSVMEMAEGESVQVVMDHIFDRFDWLRKEQILVKDDDGEWVDTGCLTVTEFLECTI